MGPRVMSLSDKKGDPVSGPRPNRVGEPWEAEFAGLSQQVTGLEADYRDLKGVVVNLDRKMDAGFASLNSKIDSRNITPWASIWAALGVLLAGMTTVGWLALQPIQSSSVESRNEIKHLRDRHDETASRVDQMRGMIEMYRLREGK